jgi:hypothetical protein
MRVALQNPAYCSACFGARPGEKHIDFEAAYDGPVINSDAGIKVAIDDLVICEKCLIAAASLIGLTNADELRAEIILFEIWKVHKEISWMRKFRRRLVVLSVDLRWRLMELISIILFVAFIVNNALWLIAWNKNNQEAYKERFTLLERIMRPNFIPSEPITPEEDIEPSPEDLQQAKEYAAVGDVGDFKR